MSSGINWGKQHYEVVCVKFVSGALIASEKPQVEMFGIPWPDYFYLLVGSAYTSPQTL